jgi:lipopolysaccharide export system protein LptC
MPYSTETPFDADPLDKEPPRPPRQSNASQMERLRMARHQVQSPRDTHRHSSLYSRFVVMMKFALPALAVILVTLIVIWPHLKEASKTFRLGLIAGKIHSAETPGMVNARYAGADKNNNPFTITADLAKSSVAGDMSVELEMPKADLVMQDGSWLVLTAETGIYNNSGNNLDLAGKVNLFHDSGYEFRTSKAGIDLAEGNAKGNDPVEGQGLFGTLNADGFRVENQGKNIVFMGKAKLIFFPGTNKKDL